MAKQCLGIQTGITSKMDYVGDSAESHDPRQAAGAVHGHQGRQVQGRWAKQGQEGRHSSKSFCRQTRRSGSKKDDNEPRPNPHAMDSCKGGRKDRSPPEPKCQSFGLVVEEPWSREETK